MLVYSPPLALVRGTCQPWKLVPSPAPVNAQLGGISTIAGGDAWAVGSRGENALIERWDGSRWKNVQPADPKGSLTGVWAIAPRDAWAVGYVPGPHVLEPLIEHWGGGKWSRVPAPTPGFYHQLADVGGVAANDRWAVGNYTDSNGDIHGMAFHWDGATWSNVSVPDTGSGANLLLGVWGTATDDVWAVGYYEPEALQIEPLLDHWDGQTWSGVAGPVLPAGTNMLVDVGGASPADVWAVGSYGPGPILPLVERWDGATWSLQDAPGPQGTSNYLSAVWATAQNDSWAVGVSVGEAGARPLIDHWDGEVWTTVRSPFHGTGSSLFDVTASSSGDVWAVGVWFDSQGFLRPLTQRSQGCQSAS
jgi:hypothetical protein